MSDAQVTCVLLNYKRPDNIPVIIEALRAQTLPVDILLINNSGHQTFGVKRAVSIPWNAGTWIRIPFSAQAETPYVMWLDDDLVPTHPQFVESMRWVTECRKDAIVGAWGKRLITGDNCYSDAPDVDGWVEVVKGRCLMFHRNLLQRVTLSNAIRPYPYRHDDIYLSLEIGRGEQTNWSHPPLREHLQELPASYAESQRPDHWEGRDQCVRWHLDRIALDEVLTRATTIPHLCTREELRFLHQCAMRAPEGSEIVECGCYLGSSAVVLADVAYKHASRLTLIDRFHYGTQEYGISSAELVRANLNRAHVPAAVRIITDTSTNAPEDMGPVGFLHIDTDHRPEWLAKELGVWLERMAPGGVMAFHDYCHNSPGLIEFIDEWDAVHPEWKRIGLVRWMIAFQKDGGDV